MFIPPGPRGLRPGLTSCRRCAACPTAIRRRLSSRNVASSCGSVLKAGRTEIGRHCQATSDNRQLTTYNRQPTTNNRNPTTGNRQLEPHNWQPTTGTPQLATDNCLLPFPAHAVFRVLKDDAV